MLTVAGDEMVSAAVSVDSEAGDVAVAAGLKFEVKKCQLNKNKLNIFTFNF